VIENEVSSLKTENAALGDSVNGLEVRLSSVEDQSSFLSEEHNDFKDGIQQLNTTIKEASADLTSKFTDLSSDLAQEEQERKEAITAQEKVDTNLTNHVNSLINLTTTLQK